MALINSSKIVIFSLFFVYSLAVSFPAEAKVLVIKKPDTTYDLKKIKNIIVPVITSDNVDFGNVADGRLPKIKAILEDAKRILRRELAESTRLADATIAFHYDYRDVSPSTAILKINIEKFDNGNQVARLVPLAGKAKVSMRWQLLDAQNKEVLTEFTAQAKAKGGHTSVIGGVDSEVLLTATNKTGSKLYRHLSKLIGFEYSRFSHVGEKIIINIEDNIDVIKEEKHEFQKK